MSSPVNLQVGKLCELLSTLFTSVVDQLRVNLEVSIIVCYLYHDQECDRLKVKLDQVNLLGD